MKYQYSPELKNVLQAFRDVKKSYSYRDLADGAPDAKIASTLRRAYLSSLKSDLLVLYSTLDVWINSGAQMEVTE